MTDLPFTSSVTLAPPRRREISRVGVLYATALLAGGVGAAVAIASEPVAGYEWQLALLLRFMAAVKAAMVLAALGLTHWRLREPIGAGAAAGYVAAVALMLVAPGLIWSLRHIALGAGLFHAGLILFLVLAWRDDAPSRLLASRRR